MTPRPDSALLIVGHGSTVNPDSSDPTHAHADAIRARGLFGEVVCAFWKEEPSLREVPRMIESREIFVVPNFISEGYFTRKIIPRELELTGPVTEREGRVWRYCPPVGSHPRMTEALLRRARDIAPGVPPAETSLLIIGHGTSLNDNSATAVKEQVTRIAAMNLYAEVLAGFMEEEPFCSDWTRLASQRSVVAVPFFVSDGLHSYQDIPVLLGIEPQPTAAASERGLFRDNPHRLAGRDLYYANAIGTEPLFAEVIVEQAAAAA